jgi:hypothetical protein
VSPQKARSTVKTLKKRRRLQLWQAYSVFHSAAVKERVDRKYTEYLAEVGRSAGVKPMSRLRFLQLTCLEMYAESDEAAQEDLNKRINEDTLDIPEDLQDAQDVLGEEETKRYLENYRQQM